MMKIKKGIFFYKLLVEKTETLQKELTFFLFKQKLLDKDLALVQQHDFNTDENIFVKHIKFELNIKSKPQTNEVILLFQTDMASDEFNDLVEGYFE